MNTSGILGQNSNPTAMFQFMAEVSRDIAKLCGLNPTGVGLFCGSQSNHADTDRCRVATNSMAYSHNSGKGMA